MQNNKTDRERWVFIGFSLNTIDVFQAWPHVTANPRSLTANNRQFWSEDSIREARLISWYPPRREPFGMKSRHPPIRIRNSGAIPAYVPSKETPTMTNQLSQIKWGRVILTALAVYILGFLAVFLVVTGYASVLAFQSRGAPDQALITGFANQFAPWIGPICLLLFTFLGARHLARRVNEALPLHGIILGALAGLINFALSGLEAGDLLVVALTIGAGWLGARK
jgi:hypothetical protein